MKNRILTFLIVFLILPIVAGAQSLRVEHAENVFKLNKVQLLDSLKAAGFTNLSDKEIEDEDFKNSSSFERPNTKAKLYTKTGVRKAYELKKKHWGGYCKVTVQMKEPTCKSVDKIFWNANLKLDAGHYARKFETLGYEKVIENNTEKYINSKKGLVITVKINQRANEVMFMMARTSYNN